MPRIACRHNGLLFVCFLVILLIMTACGTLEVVRVEPAVTPISPANTAISTDQAVASLIPTANLIEVLDESETIPAIAWYGTVHSEAAGEPVVDYFKPWHLDIWPKFGPAVGISGSDAAINAEIDRLRGTDTKATFWGRFACGVGDYGGCQLLVSRLSANDGGPVSAPDPVEGWEGIVGRLLVQPGSQDERLYFVLNSEIPVLYGIASADPSVQAELERLKETGSTIRIWGEVRSKAQPVTGTLIDVERLKMVDPP